MIRSFIKYMLITCILLWVASFWGGWWMLRRPWWSIDVQLHQGTLTVGYCDISKCIRPNTADVDWAIGKEFIFSSKLSWPSLIVNRSPSIGFSTVDVDIPISTFTIFFSVIAIYLLLPVHIRRKRKKKGLCEKCAYDLRGLTEPRCPECGTAFDPKLLSEKAVECVHEITNRKTGPTDS